MKLTCGSIEFVTTKYSAEFRDTVTGESVGMSIDDFAALLDILQEKFEDFYKTGQVK